MNTMKIRAALDDLIEQRKVIDDAVTSLQRILQSSNGSDASGDVATVSLPELAKSYIDETVELLREEGRPLHVNMITKRISEKRGREVARPSVESSLISHMKHAGERSRVVRMQPGTYGLPEWKVVPRGENVEAA